METIYYSEKLEPPYQIARCHIQKTSIFIVIVVCTPHMASDSHTHTHTQEGRVPTAEDSLQYDNKTKTKLPFSGFWRRVVLFPTSLLPLFSNSINQEQAVSPKMAVFASHTTGRHDSRVPTAHIIPIVIALEFNFSYSSHAVSPGRPSPSSVSSIRAFSVQWICCLTHHTTAVLYAPPALQLQKFTFSLQSVFIYMYKKHSFLYQIIGVCNGGAVYFSWGRTEILFLFTS
jgi:hypothetical protein